MHYLLSDYFFPNVESKHYEKICDQLIDMDKTIASMKIYCIIIFNCQTKF